MRETWIIVSLKLASKDTQATILLDKEKPQINNLFNSSTNCFSSLALLSTYRLKLPGTCPVGTSGLARSRSICWGGRPCCPPPPRWTASSHHLLEDVSRQHLGRWPAAGTQRAWTQTHKKKRKKETLHHRSVHQICYLMSKLRLALLWRKLFEGGKKKRPKYHFMMKYFFLSILRIQAPDQINSRNCKIYVINSAVYYFNSDCSSPHDYQGDWIQKESNQSQTFKRPEAIKTPIWTAVKESQKSMLTSDEAPGHCWCLPAWRWSWGRGWRGSEGTFSPHSSPGRTGLPCRGGCHPPASLQLQMRTEMIKINIRENLFKADLLPVE